MFEVFAPTFLKSGLVAAVLALSVSMPIAASTAEADLSHGSPAADSDVPIILLVDITSGQVLFARNPTRRFVPASVTKTLTALVAFDLMKAGKLSAEQEFTISEKAYEEWNGEGSTMWLDDETPVSVDDLLMGILSVSANDGSIVLAEGAAGSVPKWLDMMNAKARDIGMNSSHFGTPNGWPDDGYTFTTAEDLVRLARAVIAQHPQRFERYFGNPTFAWNGIEQRNRDPLLGAVYGADGLKTGFTREAGSSFLGTAARGGQRLVVVVAGASRESERNRVARSMIEWGFDAFDREELLGKGDYVGTARVQGGTARTIDLVTDRTVFANIAKGRSSEMSATIQYDGPIRAPIKAGTRVATLEVNVPGMKPARVPLLAQEDVGVAGPIDRLLNGIAGWFS